MNESGFSPIDEDNSGEKKGNDSMNLGRIGAVVLGVVVLLVGGVILTTEPSGGGSVENRGFRTEDSTFIGKKAPEFRLADVEGNEVALSNFKGKVVVINFWATWCAPCREEIPGFIKLQRAYGDQLVIVGISMDLDGPSVVPQFVESFGMNYPVLYGDETVSRAYGDITAIPISFILDRNLIVRRVHIGYRPYSQFEQDIESLL